jgi:hypothetical protein
MIRRSFLSLALDLDLFEIEAGGLGYRMKLCGFARLGSIEERETCVPP